MFWIIATLSWMTAIKGQNLEQTIILLPDSNSSCTLSKGLYKNDIESLNSTISINASLCDSPIIQFNIFTGVSLKFELDLGTIVNNTFVNNFTRKAQIHIANNTSIVIFEENQLFGEWELVFSHGPIQVLKNQFIYSNVSNFTETIYINTLLCNKTRIFIFKTNNLTEVSFNFLGGPGLNLINGNHFVNFTYDIQLKQSLKMISVYGQAPDLIQFEDNSFKGQYQFLIGGANFKYNDLTYLHCTSEMKLIFLVQGKPIIIDQNNFTFFYLNECNLFYFTEKSITTFTKNRITNGIINQGVMLYSNASDLNIKIGELNILNCIFIDSSILQFKSSYRQPGHTFLFGIIDIKQVNVKNNTFLTWSTNLADMNPESITDSILKKLSIGPLVLMLFDLNYQITLQGFVFRSNHLKFQFIIYLYQMTRGSTKIRKFVFSHNEINIVEFRLFSLNEVYFFEIDNMIIEKITVRTKHIQDQFTGYLTFLQNLVITNEDMIQRVNGISQDPQRVLMEMCLFNQINFKLNYPVRVVAGADCFFVNMKDVNVNIVHGTSIHILSFNQQQQVLDITLLDFTVVRDKQMEENFDLPFIEINGNFQSVNIENCILSNLSFSLSAIRLQSIEISFKSVLYYINISDIQFINSTISSSNSEGSSLFSITILFPHNIVIRRLTINGFSVILGQKIKVSSCYIYMISQSTLISDDLTYIMQSPIMNIVSLSGNVLVYEIFIIDSIISQGQAAIYFESRNIIFNQLTIQNIKINNGVILQLKAFIITLRKNHYNLLRAFGEGLITIEAHESAFITKLIINDLHVQHPKANLLKILSRGKPKVVIDGIIVATIMFQVPPQQLKVLSSIIFFSSQSVSITISYLMVTQVKQESSQLALLIIDGSEIPIPFLLLVHVIIKQSVITSLVSSSLIQRTEIHQFICIQVKNHGPLFATYKVNQFVGINIYIINTFIGHQIIRLEQGIHYFRNLIVKSVECSLIQSLIEGIQNKQLTLIRCIFSRINTQTLKLIGSSLLCSQTIFLQIDVKGANSTASITDGLVQIEFSIFFKIKGGLYGGAIHYIQNNQQNALYIERVQIIDNQADYGGGITFYSNQPYLHRKNLESNIRSNKAIKSGPNVYKYPDGVVISMIFPTEVETRLLQFHANSNQRTICFQNIRSGSKANIQIEFVITQGNSKRMSYSDEINPELIILTYSTIREMLISRQDSNGTYLMYLPILLQTDTIQNLQTSMQIDFRALYKQFNETFNAYKFDVIFQFRTCKIGEYVSNNACVTCQSTKYSLDYPVSNQTQCKECPQGCKCEDGLINAVVDGSWRQNNSSDTILYCFNQPDNCVNGSCLVGHIGPLCEICDYFAEMNAVNYFSTSNFGCMECTDSTQTIQIMQGFIFLVFLQVLQISIIQNGLILMVKVEYLRYSRLLTLGVSGLLQLSGVFIKVTINHLQIFSLFIQLNSLALAKLHNFQNFQSNVSSFFSITNLDPKCVLYKMLFLKGIFQQLDIIILLVQVTFIILIILMIQMIVSLIKKQPNKSCKYVLIFVSIYIFYYPQVSERIFTSSSCRNIGGESYISSYINDKCFNSHHFAMIGIVALPLFVLTLIIIPYKLYSKLSQEKSMKNIIQYSFTLKYGVIIQDYNERSYFFEFTRIIIRVGIQFVISLLLGYPKIKTLALVQILGIYSLITHHIAPFIIKKLQNYDKVSTNLLITSFITSLILQESQSDGVSFLFLIVVIVVNGLFVLLLLTEIIIQMFYENRPVIIQLLEKSSRLFKFKLFSVIKHWRKLRIGYQRIKANTVHDTNQPSGYDTLIRNVPQINIDYEYYF